MCKSRNEGGQRCAAHTRPKYEAANIGTREWDEAAAAYASTPEGHTVVAEDADRLAAAGDYENEARARTALKQGEAIRAANGETASLINLQTAEPKEIDAELADLYYDEMRAEARLDSEWHSLSYTFDRRDAWARRNTPMSQSALQEAADAALASETTAPYAKTDIEKKLAKIAALEADIAAAKAKSVPLNGEFERRGRWTRAFLVNNNNGHVHKNMDCSTCFPTTQYRWMTDYSGMDEATIVADAGERCCSACFPSAPTETFGRPTRMFTPDEINAAEARTVRAAEKLERDRKKLEKAILPDGSELRWKTYGGYTKRTATLVSARKGLVDLLGYRGTSLHDPDTVEGIELLSGAIAAKEDKTPEQVITEAEERLRKRNVRG